MIDVITILTVIGGLSLVGLCVVFAAFVLVRREDELLRENTATWWRDTP